MFKFVLIVLSFLSILGANGSRNVLLDLKKLLHELTQDADTYKPRNYEHKSRHHKSPNLMNIQTMNLYFKPKENLEKYLRTESDRLCRETGRCGCIAGRCGDQDEVADEINKIIDNVNQKSIEDRKGNNLSDVLRCDGNRCGDILRNLNDLDLIILDAKDLSDLDLQVLKNLATESINKQVFKYAEDLPSPDDFVNHYEIVRNDVLEQLLNYIQNNTPIPLKHLHGRQKQLLKNLKLKYEIGRINDKELKSKIIKIVFGKDSGAKIHPHHENNDHIYIPKWHYNSLLQYKRDTLRAQKRLLPLTTQQKERMNNKQAIPKTIAKLAWRRNLNQNQRYGIPFHLEVEGLGQINP